MPTRLLSTIIALLLSLALADAASASGLSPERNCREKVAREGLTYLRSASAALRSCHDKIAAGKLPPATDCGLEPVTVGRMGRAESRFEGKLASACSDAVVASLVFGDACFASATVDDLTACQLDLHRDLALGLTETLYDTSGELAGDPRDCQATTAKAASRVARRRHDGLRRCKNRVNAGALAPQTDCDARADGELAGLLSREQANISADCSDAVVAGLDFGAPCASVTTSAGLVACALGAHRTAVDRAVRAEYGSGPAGTGTALAAAITDSGDCVGGPLARCRVGDYLLANDQIRVVVQSIQRNMFGIGQFGGQIIDADLVRQPGDPDRDNFEEWATAINIENTAHYTDLTIINDGSDGQAAILRATGVDDLLDYVNASSTVAGFGFPFPTAANDQDLPVEIVTDYVLEPGRRAVRVDTRIQNTGAAALSVFFGEYINGSGQVELFQPGYGFGEPLVAAKCPTTAANPCNLLAYAGYEGGEGVSYGYVHEVPGSSSFSTSGVSVPLLGVETTYALIGFASPNFTIAALGNPGDSLTFTRYFVVGDGSVGSIIDERNAIQYLPTGLVEGTVLAGGAPAAGARIAVYGSTSDGPGVPLGALMSKNVVTEAYADDDGHYSLTVAPGTYNLVANLAGSPFEGGGSSPLQHSVTVAPFVTHVQDFALPATGALHVLVTDQDDAPIAAKVSVVGFDPSSDPTVTQSILGLINNKTGVFGDLGKDGVPFGVTQAVFVDHGGDSGVVPLEPGSYRVIVSHGPEYSVATSDVVVTAGATTTVNAQVARVIDSTGFISGDFHVHSIDSPDAATPRTDRVVSMLAEGMDFFTPSDHEFRADFTPAIAAIGATGLISVAPSGETTTFDYGHFNAWPMTIDGSKVNGGAVDHGGAAPDGQDFPSFGNYSLTPAEIVAELGSDPGANTVQVNHVHSFFGLDGGSGLAIDSGLTPPQSAVPGAARRLDPGVGNYFTDTFDALEIWIGDDRGQVYTNLFGRNFGDWVNLLNQGIVRTAVADSDTHRRIITQAGVPRTMVASPSDDPGDLGALADTLSGHVNAGRAFGTNGPMLRFTALANSTAEAGGLELGLPTLIATNDGEVDVSVDIQSPVWAEFDRVEFYVNATTTKFTSSKQSGAGMVTLTRYTVAPSYVKNKGTDFSVSTVTVDGAIPGAQRLEATVDLHLSGLTDDVWIVAVVRGTDGVSRPLFPVVPNSLKQSTNTTLANLIDGNLGEDGMTALALTNPLFVDVDGGGWTAPGVQIAP